MYETLHLLSYSSPFIVLFLMYRSIHTYKIPMMEITKNAIKSEFISILFSSQDRIRTCNRGYGIYGGLPASPHHLSLRLPFRHLTKKEGSGIVPGSIRRTFKGYSLIIDIPTYISKIRWNIVTIQGRSILWHSVCTYWPNQVRHRFSDTAFSVTLRTSSSCSQSYVGTSLRR